MYQVEKQIVPYMFAGDGCWSFKIYICDFEGTVTFICCFEMSLALCHKEAPPNAPLVLFH